MSVTLEKESERRDRMTPLLFIFTEETLKIIKYLER